MRPRTHQILLLFCWLQLTPTFALHFNANGASVQYVNLNVDVDVIDVIWNVGFLTCVTKCSMTVPCRAVTFDPVLLECRTIARELELHSSRGHIVVSNMMTWNMTFPHVKRTHSCRLECEMLVQSRDRRESHRCLANTPPPVHEFKYTAIARSPTSNSVFYILAEAKPYLPCSVVFRTKDSRQTGGFEFHARRRSCTKWLDIVVTRCRVGICIYLLARNGITSFPEPRENFKRHTNLRFVEFRFKPEVHLLLVRLSRVNIFFTLIKDEDSGSAVLTSIDPGRGKLTSQIEPQNLEIPMPIIAYAGDDYVFTINAEKVMVIYTWLVDSLYAMKVVEIKVELSRITDAIWYDEPQRILYLSNDSTKIATIQ